MELTLEQVAIKEGFEVSRIPEFENLLIIKYESVRSYFDVSARESFERLREKYKGKDMIFDFQGITNIDSAGLGRLIAARGEMNSGGSYFDICNVQDNVQENPNPERELAGKSSTITGTSISKNPAKKFKVTGASNLFPGYQNSFDQALEAYRPHLETRAKNE